MRGDGRGRDNPTRRPGSRARLRIENGQVARRVLITGGAGFVGANLADRLMSMGRAVTVLDNCARPGVEHNLAWLRSRHPQLLAIELADVCDAAAVRRAVASADAVFHFAAQVAVTTSLIDPVADFEVNARGTLNVLEAIRASASPPPAIVTSTNKVYGALEDIELVEDAKRWVPRRPDVQAHGIDEQRPLSFHSPYGCSKGAADQYVLDYARTYDLPTAVFRMSCIYGPRQFGTEDQGWVAHFLIRALEGERISLYGDGKQVRDILFVDDLVNAFVLGLANIDRLSGQVFNVGGGPANAVSLIELLDLIAEVSGERPRTTLHQWRTGDQRYYVSNTRKLAELIDWAPRTSVREGVERLYFWLLENRAPAVRRVAAAAPSELLLGEPRP